MPGRDAGYYGPSSGDLGRGALVVIALSVIGVVFVAALCAMTVADAADATADNNDSSERAGRMGDLAIDVTNQLAMHDAGLPTKADVIAWHMYGRWGFGKVNDGVYEVHIWEDLPGCAWIWDALYGIDSGNPAFKFKGEVRDYDED